MTESDIAPGLTPAENIVLEFDATFKDPAGDRKYHGYFTMPAQLKKIVEKWGESVVVMQVAQRIQARLGHRVRMALTKGKSDEEIALMLSSYVPTLYEPKEPSEEASYLNELKEIKKIGDPDARSVRLAELVAKMSTGD